MKIVLIIWVMISPGIFDKHVLSFTTMKACMTVQTVYSPKRKVRWPKNIYKDGGGQGLYFIPCRHYDDYNS